MLTTEFPYKKNELLFSILLRTLYPIILSNQQLNYSGIEIAYSSSCLFRMNVLLNNEYRSALPRYLVDKQIVTQHNLCSYVSFFSDILIILSPNFTCNFQNILKSIIRRSPHFVLSVNLFPK